ncbi:MAG: Do family serine endopeptidase [Planctomycetaceae bacterium]|nr:Do family serine endopeptidase [Planctomycetaceae bacterium]
MSLRQVNYKAVGAVLCGISLTWVAAGLAQREEVVTPETAQDARALSTVFRSISKEALPGIVSIRTRGKAVPVGGNNMQFDEDLLPAPFRNDPRFRDLFRNRMQNQQPQYHQPQGMGSGFIIDPAGVVMTNNHVVRDAEEVRIRLQDGREFIATDIRTDPRTDVAIVRFDAPAGLHSLKLGNSDNMQIGDWVLAVGSPFGLDLSVTSGIISARGRGPGIAEREDFLQTDAAINPGNSGGPLLNLDGEVIGINTAISTRSGGYDGIGFAIPGNMARWVADQLIETGTVQRAYLGVAIQPMDNDLAEKFGVPVGQGAIVSQVMPDSPAAEAGLQAGDVVLSVDGKNVLNPRSLQGLVEQLKVGEQYPLKVLRGGDRVELQLKARAMPQDFSLSSRRQPAGREEEEWDAPAEAKADKLGLTVQELTAEMAEQLKTTAGQGVVVTRVERGSLAQRAGLKPGLIIEQVDRKPVNSPDEFAAAANSVSLEEGVLLLIRSGESTRFIVLKSRG